MLQVFVVAFNSRHRSWFSELRPITLTQSLLLVQQKCCEDVFLLLCFHPTNHPCCEPFPQCYLVIHEALCCSASPIVYRNVVIELFSGLSAKKEEVGRPFWSRDIVSSGRKAFFLMFVIIYQMSYMFSVPIV